MGFCDCTLQWVGIPSKVSLNVSHANSDSGMLLTLQEKNSTTFLFLPSHTFSCFIDSTSEQLWNFKPGCVYKGEQFPITGCLLLGSKWGILHFWRCSLITCEWKKWETQGQRALMKFHYRHQFTDLVMKYKAGQKIAYSVWGEKSNCV